MTHLVARMRPYERTIFGEMSALATRLGAVNLGQGFPDTGGPDEVRRAAERAIAEGHGDQYPPAHGNPVLRAAVSEHQRRFYGIDVDPDCWPEGDPDPGELRDERYTAILNGEDP